MDTTSEEDSFNLKLRDALCQADVKVVPHWCQSSNSFWYLRATSHDSREFIHVDISEKNRKQAFDHDLLTELLSDRLGEQLCAKRLPFTWINVANDASWIRFQAGEDKWQFSAEGELVHFAGDIGDPNLQPIAEDAVSTSGEVPTSVTFVNRLKTTLSLDWIEPNRAVRSYGEIAPGEKWTQKTYTGHVWRLSDSAGKIVGTYQAIMDDAEAVISERSQEKAVKDSPSDADAHTLESKTHTQISETSPASDNSGREVFVRNYNVWIREVDGTEIQLSKDGRKDRPYREEAYMCPDESFAVAWKYTPAQTHEVHMVESSPDDQLQPKLKTIEYLKPGDRCQVDRPCLFDLTDKCEISTSDKLFQNPFELQHHGWSKGGEEYRFLYNERGHKTMRFLGINKKGDVQILIEESSETFIDYSEKQYLKQIEDRDETIWASERDGRNHLYLYDLKTGNLKHQITKGPYVVRRVEGFSSDKIWFGGYGFHDWQDPYFEHLACINHDGSGLNILTDGDGNHIWKWSPDHRYFIDTWSRVDHASQTVVRDGETGEELLVLEKGDTKPLLEFGWTVPERFQALGRDGQTPIHGIIIKPSGFNPDKHYPIIENLYAGPQDFYTPKSFSPLDSEREFANLGFVVVQLDGMGTNWRTRAFHDVCYKNLKDAGFIDRVEWVKAAARTRPWMDLSRVGVYGSSAGGQNAMAALLFHGDFYKVAVADSGCHDNRMDKIWWNEQWMGWPVDQSYEDSSNVFHAAKLQGKLMLMVGELDTNVDPASTMQVVNALNKAEKDYELVFFPGQGHGVGLRSVYGLKRAKAFFQRHLLNDGEKGN